VRATSPTSTATPKPAGGIPAATGSTSGKIIVIDPGHTGGNAAHARDVAIEVDVGNGNKKLDTVGAQTADGYPGHAPNIVWRTNMNRCWFAVPEGAA
jgi:hypothetical protein